jgi:hypothetical protein
MSRFKRTKTLIQRLDQHIALINLLVLISVLMIGLMYIIQVNHSTTKGYLMRDLETRIEQLGIANQQLELEVAGNRSIATIDERIQMLGLKPVETPEYVSTGASTVAMQR